MMEYIYHAEAFDEYREAVSHYKSISGNVANQFVINVEQAIALIREQPNAWMVVSKNIRRSIVKGYPYSIFFSDYSEKIYILAIAHQKRKPNYWKKRKP